MIKAMYKKKTREVGEAVKDASKRLGFTIRPKQLDIAAKFVGGSGKSLCYWVLLWASDKLRKHSNPICILAVVSPLTALINEQVKILLLVLPNS